MTYILLAPAAFVALSLQLWLYYLAVMRLKQTRDAGTFPPDAETPARIVLVIGALLDATYNIVIGTVVFLDLPREWMLTDRLKRYQDKGGRRGKMADYICRTLLDRFDPAGCHCRKSLTEPA